MSDAHCLDLTDAPSCLVVIDARGCSGPLLLQGHFLNSHSENLCINIPMALNKGAANADGGYVFWHLFEKSDLIILWQNVGRTKKGFE